MAESVDRRVGGVDAERVLGRVAAIRPDQRPFIGSVAHVGDDGGDGVHHVVVPRAAGERQTTRAGQLTVEAEAQRCGAELHRGGETGVQVDDADVVDADSGQVEGGPTAGADGRCVGKVPAFRDERVLMTIGARMDKHPTVAGDAQLGRLGGRAHDQGGTLIDVVVRVHQLRIWEPDHPVRHPDGGDLLG